jgi:hypothetical protein
MPLLPVIRPFAFKMLPTIHVFDPKCMLHFESGTILYTTLERGLFVKCWLKISYWHNSIGGFARRSFLGFNKSIVVSIINIEVFAWKVFAEQFQNSFRKMP